jgi:hypothetical protein
LLQGERIESEREGVRESEWEREINLLQPCRS